MRALSKIGTDQRFFASPTLGISISRTSIEAISGKLARMCRLNPAPFTGRKLCTPANDCPHSCYPFPIVTIHHDLRAEMFQLSRTRNLTLTPKRPRGVNISLLSKYVLVAYKVLRSFGDGLLILVGWPLLIFIRPGLPLDYIIGKSWFCLLAEKKLRDHLLKRSNIAM